MSNQDGVHAQTIILRALEYVNENRLRYCNRRVGFAANPNKYGVVLSDFKFKICNKKLAMITKLMFSSSLRWCSLVSLDNQNKIIFFYCLLIYKMFIWYQTPHKTSFSSFCSSAFWWKLSLATLSKWNYT